MITRPEYHEIEAIGEYLAQVPYDVTRASLYSAADLYDKVATFEDTFTGIGDLITRLSGIYDKAKKQMYDGPGNVMRRVEGLKALGVTPKKQLKALENVE